MIIDLGISVRFLCSRMRGGILIFFSSSRLMNNVWDIWNDSNVVKNIEKTKKIFHEPKTQTELD